MTLELQRRVSRLAAQAKARAARNRAAAPEFAEFVDAFRKVFPGSRVIYVRWPDGTSEGKSAGEGVVYKPAPKCVRSEKKHQGSI